jgi:hypothetical protein
VPTKEARSDQRPRSSPAPQQNEHENENEGLFGCVFCHRGWRPKEKDMQTRSYRCNVAYTFPGANAMMSGKYEKPCGDAGLRYGGTVRQGYWVMNSPHLA